VETHLRMTTEGSSKDNDNQHAARILFLPPTRIADKTASGNAGSSQSVALEFWRDRSSHRTPIHLSFVQLGPARSVNPYPLAFACFPAGRCFFTPRSLSLRRVFDHSNERKRTIQSTWNHRMTVE